MQIWRGMAISGDNTACREGDSIMSKIVMNSKIIEVGEFYCFNIALIIGMHNFKMINFYNS
jgi:hypothetical protein